jgi:hypothetical protein
VTPITGQGIEHGSMYANWGTVVPARRGPRTTRGVHP